MNQHLWSLTMNRILLQKSRRLPSQRQSVVEVVKSELVRCFIFLINDYGIKKLVAVAASTFYFCIDLHDSV